MVPKSLNLVCQLSTKGIRFWDASFPAGLLNKPLLFICEAEFAVDSNLRRLKPRAARQWTNTLVWCLKSDSSEQILLILINCDFGSDLIIEKWWKEVRWRYWCAEVGLLYNSVWSWLFSKWRMVSKKTTRCFEYVEVNLIDDFLFRDCYNCYKNSEMLLKAPPHQSRWREHHQWILLSKQVDSGIELQSHWAYHFRISTWIGRQKWLP